MRRDWVYDSFTSDKLLCTTSAYHTAADGGVSQGLISLMIDSVQVDLNHTLFTYTDDPVITDVQPATSFVRFVRLSYSAKYPAIMKYCYYYYYYYY